MSASDVINAPITATLAGHEYKIRRVSVMRMLACAEDYIIRQHMRRVRMIGDALGEEDRLTIVREETAKLPSNKDLAAQGRALIVDPPDEVACDILLAALEIDHPALSRDEVALIFQEATEQETQPVMKAIVGNSSAPTQTSTGRSRKRTTGRRK